MNELESNWKFFSSCDVNLQKKVSRIDLKVIYVIDLEVANKSIREKRKIKAIFFLLCEALKDFNAIYFPYFYFLQVRFSQFSKDSCSTLTPRKDRKEK